MGMFIFIGRHQAKIICFAYVDIAWKSLFCLDIISQVSGTEGGPVTLRCPVHHPTFEVSGKTRKTHWRKQNKFIAYLVSFGSNVVVNTSFGDDNIRITSADADLTIGIS